MILIRNIICLIILSMTLSACDIEPNVFKKRIFTGEGQDEIFELLPADGDLPERICAPIDALLESQSSGPEWLKQKWIDPTTGEEVTEVGPIGYIVLQIKTQLDAGVEAVFKAFEDNTTFQEIIQLVMILAIIIYAVGIISGVVPTQLYTLIGTIIKLALIVALVSEYDTFEEIVKNFFEGLVDGLINIMSQNFSTEEVTKPEEVFNPADDLLTKFFSMEYTIIYMALIPTGWTGFFYAITMLLATVGFLFAVLRAVYIYLTALVVRGLLYAMAPIFITLAMLKSTKSLFDGWLQQLISYTLQPVLLFAFLSVFFEIITSFMGVLGVSSISGASDICYMESVHISHGADKILYWWAFSGPDGINAKGGINPQISINLTVLFTFLVLSYIMVMFGTWAIEVAHHMSSGFMSAAGPAASGWANLRQRMISPAGRASGAAGKMLGGHGDLRGHAGSAIGDSVKRVDSSTQWWKG